MYFNPKEVLYEITLKCNKNCEYCGSKNFLNKSDENINKVKIAEEIASVNPDEITITGGEPSIDSNLQDVLNVFYSKNIKSKVITNGNLFTLNNFKELDKKIYWYGYSINDLSDIEYCKKIFDKIPFNKVTMTTNFGTDNLKYFNELAKISGMFTCWQIQLTMGNELQLDFDDIDKLYNQIDKIDKSEIIKVVKADNLICGQCKAGTRSFSVCWNGDVVPCLSYRSWKKDMDIQGNLLNEKAIDIWNNKFEFYRNRKFFPCCKDITGVNKLNTNTNNIEIIDNPLKVKPIDEAGIVMVYGVVIPKELTPIVYGVTSTDSINLFLNEDNEK